MSVFSRFVYTMFFSVAFALAPFAAHAAPRTLNELVGLLLGIIQLLVMLVIGLTTVVFMWGVIQGWILQSGDEKGMEKGKRTAITGIIVLTVMGGLWGAISLVQSLFGF